MLKEQKAGMIHDFGTSDQSIVVLNIPLRLAVHNIFWNKFPQFNEENL